MKEIGSGAEAKIYLDDGAIVKDRISKAYRLKDIDEELRTSRTRHESKILSKLHKVIPVPKVNYTKDTLLAMEFIEGDQLKKILDTRPELAKTVGEHLSRMHDIDIIHGDLTTSNMILDNQGKLNFIDFGLSFHSKRVEDKAVDIHLFKQALLSKHFRVYDSAYKYFLSGYDPKERSDILKRLKQVEARGRYKEKV